jgi:hypothetical protein
MAHITTAMGWPQIVRRDIAAMSRSDWVPKPCTMMSQQFVVVPDRERDVEFEFSRYADHGLRPRRIR